MNSGSSESRQRLFLGSALLVYGFLRSTMATADPRLHQSGDLAILAWVYLGLGFAALLAGASLLRVWRRERSPILDTYEQRGEAYRRVKSLAAELAEAGSAEVPAGVAQVERWLAEDVDFALRCVSISAGEGELHAENAWRALENAHWSLRRARTALLGRDRALAAGGLETTRKHVERALEELGRLRA